MKGKIAFVLGAAVGYVLGSRAGRERYEQIKRGTQTIWQTAPVQRGVTVVRDAVGSQVDSLKAKAAQAGKDAFSKFMSTPAEPTGSRAGRQSGEAADSAVAASADESTADANAAAGAAASMGARRSASKSTGQAAGRSSGKAGATGGDAA